MKRVAVTGLGAVSAGGLTAGDTWEAVRDGRSGIGPIACRRGEGLRVPIAAHVRDFDPGAHFPARGRSTLDRFAQFAVVAAREAFADAQLSAEDPAVCSAPLILGVGVGGLETLDDAFWAVYREGQSKLHPLTIPKLMTNAAPSLVSMDLGLRGMTYAIASACASGTHAIGTAFHMVRGGGAQVAVTGGSEACITFGTMLAWEALRVLSFDQCRPFSRNRSGLVIGEGAAILVLEEWDRAVARGAHIYAEMVGFGGNADAGDITSMDMDNAAEAMRLAMRDGDLEPGEIDYINAHGTGTAMNDKLESAAIHRAFEGARTPLVSSSKAVLGHSLGAAGALEALVAVKALDEQVVPPTANCTEPETELGLDVVPEGPRFVPIRACLSNSFAFGGLNAVLALRRAAPC
jgi:nodulation protein E